MSEHEELKTWEANWFGYDDPGVYRWQCEAATRSKARYKAALALNSAFNVPVPVALVQVKVRRKREATT